MRALGHVLIAMLALCVAGQQTAAESNGEPGYRGIWAATQYPAQSIPAGKAVDLPITIHNAGLPPQVVQLEFTKFPENWAPVLIGDGRPVKSVFVGPDSETQVTLRLSPADQTASGRFEFVLAARSADGSFDLPIELTVGEVIPSKLLLEPELPALRGTATSNFEYKLTVTNPSGADVTARLDADAPPGFQVSFKERYGSQELTSLPIKAGEDRDITLTVNPPRRAEAGEYQIVARAIAEGSNAAVPLGMEITGRPELSLTGIGDRLSGDARAGEETSFDLVLKNDGSAPARDIQLSAFEPSGWKVAFVPEQVESLAPGTEQKIEALVTPSSEAISGDYQVSLRANAEGASDSTDFRVTVRTSTIWGVTGMVVIAAALGVLTLAILRYGRR